MPGSHISATQPSQEGPDDLPEAQPDTSAGSIVEEEIPATEPQDADIPSTAQQAASSPAAEQQSADIPSTDPAGRIESNHEATGCCSASQ